MIESTTLTKSNPPDSEPFPFEIIDAAELVREPSNYEGLSDEEIRMAMQAETEADQREYVESGQADFEREQFAIYRDRIVRVWAKEDGRPVESYYHDMNPPIDSAIELGELEAPNANDGTTLLGNRFACRRGSVMFVGPTGAGKSVLAMQMAILWGIGEPFFGIKPAAPLRCLIIQAENDEGDLWEMRDGIFRGCRLTEQQIADASENVIIASINDCIGLEFISRTEKLIERWKPDLLFIDPLLAYIGGDISKQEVCSQFLRAWLTPIITKANCAAVILHHPPKPKEERGKGSGTDDAYYGAGSSDLFNWSRAVIALKPKNKERGIYNLILAKRGRRAGWLNPDNQPTCERTIGHGADGLIYWREVGNDEANSAAAAVGKTKEDVLALVPMKSKILKNTLIQKCQAAKIGANSARAFIDELIECKLVYVSTEKRAGTNPARYISRWQEQDEPNED